MHTKKGFFAGFIIAIIGGPFVQTSAGELDIPNTFQSGTAALAAEVNQNFDAVEVAVDDNAQTIAALMTQIANLEATVTALQATLNQLSNNSVLQLDGLLALDNSDMMRPAAVFTGVNVQIVNGLGETSGPLSTNGVGNLLIGYDESRSAQRAPECSDGRYTTQVDCETQGEIWAINQKSGSHNVVVGPRHNYPRTASLVVGAYNTVSGYFSAALGSNSGVAGGQGSAVLGGGNNAARGDLAVVIGGSVNTASGMLSIVLGGSVNNASGPSSAVSGGKNNTASGADSSVNGGVDNEASGTKSVVSGGTFNTAVGQQSAVSGGSSNSAVGKFSTVSGGASRTAPNDFNWTAGSLTSPN